MPDEKKTIPVSQLVFREITADAPQFVLDMLAQKEAVHPATASTIRDTRMAPTHAPDAVDDEGAHWDKHCYGLFAPGESKPEVVVYVKLMERKTNDAVLVANRDLPGSIRHIINLPSKGISHPNTAIFYSITNTGLNKLQKDGPHSAGESLINHVAQHVHDRYGIQNLTTLSPLRRGLDGKAEGFATWLESALEAGVPVLTNSEQVWLTQTTGGEDAYAAIQQCHRKFGSLGEKNQQYFRRLMQDLGLYYLAEAKSSTKKNEPLDPVGMFHLSNGAEIANIHYHPSQETTPSDDQGAFGVMANYCYRPEMLEMNKCAYRNAHIIMDAELEKRHKARISELSPGINVRGVVPQQQISQAKSGRETDR